jgi:hypothetical protein
MQKFQTLWSFYQASDKKYVKMQWELMNHTYLHPILHYQIFPKWWWCLAEVFITEIDNLWPTRHGGRDRPGVTYSNRYQHLSEEKVREYVSIELEAIPPLFKN